MAALVSPLAAQVIVEDEIVTGDVSLFDVRSDESGQRSINAALGMSLALPGMGHYYIDKPKSAYVYLSIDLASIFGAVLFNTLANQREDQARSFATAAAGIEKPAKGEAYWRHVGRFMDAAEYNEVIELSRGDPEDQFLMQESWWHWGDESQKKEYNALRQKARDMRVASSFFIGAAVANRIFSAVDLRVFQRKSLSSGIRFEAAFTPDMSEAIVTLRSDF